MGDAEPVTTPPDRVDAVFATGKQRYMLLRDERFVSVDLSDRLGPVADEGGNEFSPLGQRSLSPDGTRVAFRQPGRVEVWDLPTNSWTSVETPDYESVAWSVDGDLWLPGDGPTGRPDPWQHGDHQYGPVVTGPGRPGRRARLDGRHRRSDHGRPRRRSPTRSSWRRGAPTTSTCWPSGHRTAASSAARSMGWFSHDFVRLRGGVLARVAGVLAWRVGTPDLYRVSRFEGFPRTGGLPRRWAEHGSLSADAS